MYAFEYKRPASLADAKVSGDARFLAGGQSLIQAMKLRLSASETLVDLGAVADLKSIKVDGTTLVIGAMVTHAAVAASADVQRLNPALAELAGGIGDPMVRNMGTIGGSIANADPAADFSVRVYDLRGAEVRGLSLTDGQVDVSALRAGTYLLNVTDGTGTSHQRFVKE